MDPWLTNNVSAGVRELCKRIIRRETETPPEFIEIEYHGMSDVEWYAIGEALKRNESSEYLSILEGGVENISTLSAAAATSLAHGISSHPSMRTLYFHGAKFEDFSAISMAILQNRTIRRLEMNRCFVSPSIKENLEFLVKHNALESLELRNNRDEDGLRYPLDLSDAFCHNQSLLELVIFDDEYITVTERTVKDIASMLRTNTHIAHLHLDLCGIDNSSDTISVLLREAKGHGSLKRLKIPYCSVSEKSIAESVTNLLTVPSALEELDLSNWSNIYPRMISVGLRHENCSLKKIDVSRSCLDESRATLLFDALQHNTLIEEISIRGNGLGDTGAQSLAALLLKSGTIRHLYISYCNIGSEGAIAIANALSVNKSLNAIDLGGNPVGEDGSRALLSAMENNTSLQNFYFYKYNDTLIEGLGAKITMFTSLNRAGRKILGSYDVPRSLWPLILAKSSKHPDVIYYFLQQKPELFMKQSILGKRKRNASG